MNMNMGSSLARVLLLLSAWLLLGTLMMAEGASVVDQLCKQTREQYRICTDCLIKTGHNDPKTLARDTISCAQRSTLIAFKTFQNIAHNSRGEPRTVAEFCLPRMKAALDAFNTALGFWSHLQKEETLRAIEDVESNYFFCSEEVPVEMSPEVNRQLGRVRAGYEVAQAVIKFVPV